MTTIRKSARSRDSPENVVSAWPAVREAAAVVVTTISRVLDNSPPTNGPTIVA